MATGVQSWSQTAATNATADGNVNYAEGQAPSSLNDSARASMSSVAKWRDDLSGTNVTAGTSSAFTLVTNQVATALTSGFTISCAFHKPCAAGATIAVDGLTAKPLQVIPGTNVQVSEYTSGIVGSFTYSSTGTGQWIANQPPVNPPALPGAMFPTFTTLTNSLGSNLSVVSSSYTDGPSVSQGSSGTWFATGQVTVQDNTGSANFAILLYDGTTIVNSCLPVTPAATAPVVASLSGIITSPAGNLKLVVKNTTRSTGFILFNQSGGSKDSTISAIRIG